MVKTKWSSQPTADKVLTLFTKAQVPAPSHFKGFLHFHFYLYPDAKLLVSRFIVKAACNTPQLFLL